MMASVPAYLQAPPAVLLEQVLEHWLGPPSQAAQVGQAEPSVDASSALRHHHEVRSRWALPIHRTCHLLQAEHAYVHEHEPPTVSVFLYEEQGVQVWGHDTDGMVWTRVEDDGEPWRPTGAGLAEFLVMYELVEGAMGAFGAVAAASAWMTRSQLDDVLAPLVALPVPAYWIVDSPHTLYGTDDVLALAGPNPFGDETPKTAVGWEVWLVGRRAGALDWLADVEAVVGVDGWPDLEHVKRYDGIVWDVCQLF